MRTDFQANFTLNVTGNALGSDTQKIEVQDAEMQMWTGVRWARHLQLARDKLKYRLHFLVYGIIAMNREEGREENNFITLITTTAL